MRNNVSLHGKELLLIASDNSAFWFLKSFAFWFWMFFIKGENPWIWLFAMQDCRINQVNMEIFISISDLALKILYQRDNLYGIYIYSLKTSENYRFSDVFMEYGNEVWPRICLEWNEKPPSTCTKDY